jgi:large subunit ribosomal protein L13
MSVDKTYVPKANEISQDWYLVDANDQNLGRLATQIASILLGKHKPNFTPGMDTGDFVVVVNCERVRVTGNKLDDKKYYRHSLYPGGLKEITLRRQLVVHPDRVIRSAVWGMLPKNKLGRQLIKKLKVYAGPDHPHEAQQPKTWVVQ